MRRIYSASVFVFFLIVLSVVPSQAYYTNMNASSVLGQDTLTANSAGIAANKLSAVIRSVVIDPKGRLIVADQSNSRILIWNTVPTRNGTPADLVLCQADFSSGLVNRGSTRNSNTCNGVSGVISDGNRLFAADQNNGRVLIWNTFPSANGQSADVVVGKANMTDTLGGCGATTMTSTHSVAIFGNKLLVTDRSLNRVLIFNSIPTTNGVAADLVIGQQDLSTTCGAQAVSSKSLADPRGLWIDDFGKVYVVDRARQRVLIWNSIPTTNYAPADVVVGQPDFVSTGAAVSPSRIGSLLGVFSDGYRLYLADGSTGGGNRVLIYNQIPSTNGAAADIVIGQSNFTNSSANQGVPTAANGFSSPQGMFEKDGRLYVLDEGNARILIFNNDVLPPALSLSNTPEGRGSDILRMSGNANTSDQYVIKNVEYSVNGGSFSGATPTDGSFASKSEDYYFDFNPKINQPKNSVGQLIDGYTIRVRSVNNNADTKDNLFYFSPFEVVSPLNHGYEAASMPTFSFTVSKNKEQLKSNLSKYQIQTKRSSDSSWATYVDSIPVDFRTVKDTIENKQRDVYGNNNTGSGIFETDKLLVTYGDDSASISVKSKETTLSGSYQWKVVAVDKSGHGQDTGIRDITVGSSSTSINSLPIALLNISGVSQSKVRALASQTLSTSTLTPTFYGIAWGGSNITLRMTLGSETKTYITTANMSSRFGINIPKGDLSRGKTYTVTVSSSFGEKYGEVYPFMLKIQ